VFKCFLTIVLPGTLCWVVFLSYLADRQVSCKASKDTNTLGEKELPFPSMRTSYLKGFFRGCARTRLKDWLTCLKLSPTQITFVFQGLELPQYLDAVSQILWIKGVQKLCKENKKQKKNRKEDGRWLEEYEFSPIISSCIDEYSVCKPSSFGFVMSSMHPPILSH